MAFICGSHANQEDNFEDIWSFPSTLQPKLTRRGHSFCSRRNKDNNNPYSNRGLDKFEALLADLDGKRQKIYTQKGSEDISLVRFTYSNSNDVQPIVVKIKDHKKQEKDQQLKFESMKTPSLSPEHPMGGATKKAANSATEVQPSKPSFDYKKLISGEWWRPWYSLSLFVIMILVFLVLFGRSFAILCTSLGWYMVPTINATSKNPKRPRKVMKKEYSRKFSEKTITSPKSIANSGKLSKKTIVSPRSVLNSRKFSEKSLVSPRSVLNSRKFSEKSLVSPRSVPNSGPMNHQTHHKSF